MEFVGYITKLKSICSSIRITWDEVENKWCITAKRNKRTENGKEELFIHEGTLLETTVKELFYKIRYPELVNKLTIDELMVSNG